MATSPKSDTVGWIECKAEATTVEATTVEATAAAGTIGLAFAFANWFWAALLK